MLLHKLQFWEYAVWKSNTGFKGIGPMLSFVNCCMRLQFWWKICDLCNCNQKLV